jgi:hypothetical protein
MFQDRKILFHDQVKIVNVCYFCLVLLSRFPLKAGPGLYSASNRNEYQKHKNNYVSGE